MNLQKPLQITDEVWNYLYLTPDIPEKYHKINFEELIEMCLGRVKCFKKIDLMMMQTNLSGKDYIDFLEQKAKKCYYEGNCFNPRSTDFEQVQDFWDRDKVTHQLLEAIYSSDEAQIRQFCRFERILLETRLKSSHLTDMVRMRIFEALGCNLKQMTKEKWDELRKNKAVDEIEKWNDYCEIPFAHVTAAVASHDCFLYKGFAYLEYRQLDNCLLDIFYDRMFERLVRLNKNIEYQQWLQQDEQMFQAMMSILNADFGQDLPQTIGNQAKITHLNIKQYANTSFPPCMKYLYDKMQENHHLKHDGRQQLQLFLKTAEMPVNEALIFWKLTFSAKFSDSEFDKKYAYNIRHNYGLEGKRSDYKCNSCAHNFKKTPGNQDYHGCPIKVFNNELFKKYLQYNDINNIDEIMELKSNNHFQVACNKIWAAKHPAQNSDFVITNPIDYFVHSVKEKQK